MHKKEPTIGLYFIPLTLLFLTLSYSVYTAFYALFVQVINGFQVIVEVLPMVLASLGLLFVFFIYIFMIYAKNSHNRHKLNFIGGIVVISLALLAFIWLLVILFVKYQGNLVYGFISEAHPLDSILIALTALAFGIVFLVQGINGKRQDLAVEYEHRNLSVKAKTVVVISFLVAFYYTGTVLNEFLFVFPFASQSTVQLFFGSFLVFPVLLFPLMIIAFYLGARVCTPTRRGLIKQLVLAIVALSITFFFSIFTMAYGLDNPYAMATIFHHLFPMGYTAPLFPVELLTTAIFALATSIPAVVILSLRLKNFDKTASEKV